MAGEADKDARALDRGGQGRAGEPQPVDAGRRVLALTAATAALRHVLEPALASALRARLPAEPALHLVDVSLTSPGSFHRSIQEPTCCYRLTVARAQGRLGDPTHGGAIPAPSRQARPHGGGQAGGAAAEEPLWVEVSPELAHPIVELLLGGQSSRVAASDQPLTAVERRLLRRLPEAVAECLSAAMAPGRMSVQLDKAAAAAAGRAGSAGREVAVLTFRLTCRPRGADGTVRVCLPVELLEAMLADQPAARPQAAIELSAAPPDARLPAADVAALEVGDILTTDTPADGEVTVRVAGVAKFAARLGACRGKRAITITRPLPPPEHS